MRCTNPLILCLASTLALSACGESPSDSTAPQSAAHSSEQVDQATSSPAELQVPLVGQFEMDGPEPFAMRAAETDLQCQSASPGSPFRAQRGEAATGMAVLVTGWPDRDGGTGTRVDNFQVVLSTPTEQKRARLSGASLSVEEISRTGRAAVYSVQASGTFEEGGTFTASGHCRA